MVCKHCESKIGLATAIINGGFCSPECKIVYQDLSENAKCDEVDFGDYEFPEVSMGGLKKSKENLKEGSEEDDADDLISGEESMQSLSLAELIQDAEDRYYEFNMLNDEDF